jgi:transcriptional regulator with XRE-family HTH domain
MTGKEFKTIRHGLLLTQAELAALLGYRHKIRISEYERATNPVAIPDHIATAMRELKATGGRSLSDTLAVREWTRAA